MFGMGMPEILLILAIALIVIGPKKLPDLAKSMGKAFGEFKRATSDFKQAIDLDNEVSSVKKTFDDIDLDHIADAAPEATAAGDEEAAETADDDTDERTDDPSADIDTDEALRAQAPPEEQDGADRNAS